MTACQETFGVHMSMVNGHKKVFYIQHWGTIMCAKKNAGRIDVSKKCVKMIFRKCLQWKKWLKGLKFREGGSAELRTGKQKSQLKSDPVFFI